MVAPIRLFAGARLAAAGPPNGYQIQGGRLSSSTLAALALAVALVLVLPRRIWRWSRLGITAVHESGHAIGALITGHKVTAIRLHPDSSGVTLHYGPAGRLRRAMTSAAGYPAPGVLAVAGAFLVAYHEPRVWFIVLLALGLLNVILWIRNVFGFVVMAAWLCGVGWLFTRGTAGIDALFGALTVRYLAGGRSSGRH